MCYSERMGQLKGLAAPGTYESGGHVLVEVLLVPEPLRELHGLLSVRALELQVGELWL